MIFPQAIVLAGGKSSRFGSDKALAGAGGQTLTALCVSRLLSVFEHVLVVSKRPEALGVRQGERVRLVRDTDQTHAALIGLVEGLRASSHRLNYVTGCDMPEVVPGLIRLLYSLARGRDCALRCDESGRPQPLGGFYSKRALPVLERFAAKREFRLSAAVAALDTALVPFDAVISLDPELSSFRNVNTPEDLVADRLS